jgi:glucokinase
MRSMTRYSIGVDLGGTNLRAAAVDPSGRMLEKITGATPLGEGPEPVVADIVRLVETLRHKHGAGNLAGIGAGIPGNILMDQGVIAGWGNRPAFNNYPIRAELEKRLGARVFLENDANAAAIGERWMGAGRGVDDLILLTLGTGVGGGIISHGRIVHGASGMAGEVGHMTVSPNGYPCGCGNRGCLEKYASATAVVAMARLLNMGDLSSQAIYELARGGNPRALQIFQAMGEALGTALASLINIFNFPLYLLGGGVLGAWELFAPPMLAEVERRCFTYRSTLHTAGRTRIEKAVLGSDAGLFGAASLPLAA